MKTSFISTLAVQNAMRSTIQRGQLEAVKLQEELTTGVRADAGADIGSSVSRLVSLKNELERMDNLTTTNSVVTQRLSASQLSLDSMRKAAEAMNTSLIAAMGSNDVNRIKIATTDMTGQLQTFTNAANTQFNGEFLLAGINTDAKPLAEYDANSAAHTSYIAARNQYLTDKGLGSVGQMSVAQMNEFITTRLEPMYTAGNAADKWGADWSDASDTNVSSRISANENIDSATNANTVGVRKIALAAVVINELLAEPVTDDVRAAVNRSAQNYVQQGISGLIDVSSTLGVSESRVKSANLAIAAQKKLVSTHIGDIEGVDPYEASTRMKALMTQIETSYTLTAKLQQMSLLNYL